MQAYGSTPLQQAMALKKSGNMNPQAQSLLDDFSQNNPNEMIRQQQLMASGQYGDAGQSMMPDKYSAGEISQFHNPLERVNHMAAIPGVDIMLDIPSATVNNWDYKGSFGVPTNNPFRFDIQNTIGNPNNDNPNVQKINKRGFETEQITNPLEYFDYSQGQNTEQEAPRQSNMAQDTLNRALQNQYSQLNNMSLDELDAFLSQ